MTWLYTSNKSCHLAQTDVILKYSCHLTMTSSSYPCQSCIIAMTRFYTSKTSCHLVHTDGILQYSCHLTMTYSSYPWQSCIIAMTWFYTSNISCHLGWAWSTRLDDMIVQTCARWHDYLSRDDTKPHEYIVSSRLGMIHETRWHDCANMCQMTRLLITRWHETTHMTRKLRPRWHEFFGNVLDDTILGQMTR
jgi:hypothetical protein